MIKKNNRIRIFIKYKLPEYCAVILHWIGFKPRCTTFIDAETIVYGYGKLNGWIGIWQFTLPGWYVNKYINKKKS